ncbi:MAG: histidine ammonia-lyase [Candidatus Aminicenantes bacterium]|nr:histidine ammonia-lyase [Candidatus Aminicenantes bacterium]
MERVIIGKRLGLKEAVRFGKMPDMMVKLSEEAKRKIEKGRQILEAHMKSRIYGVNTGFGGLADTLIPEKDIRKLQENLIKSHHAGIGDCVSPSIARTAVLIRLNSLSLGYSGIRKELAEFIVEYLNKGISPCMKEYGSVGASGDLAPLASFALSLSFPEEVEVFLWDNGWKRVRGDEAFKKAGLEPITLEAKEALSLINGTPFSAAIAAFALDEAERILLLSDIAVALTMEALLSNPSFLFNSIHEVRKSVFQKERAENVQRLIQGSELIGKTNIVQDAYSIRCYPQVSGTSTSAIKFAREVLEEEMNSATDNPLIFEEGVFSGGNFHAQPVAMASDLISMALTYISTISERRLFRLLDPKLNRGLPAFLAKNPGLNSGFMIVQYTAASLASENKTLSHPAGVDTIPTSANQEDHVSMAPIAARKALKISENTKAVLACEMIAAAQGIDFRDGKPGDLTRRVYEYIRKIVPFIHEDTPVSPYLEKLILALNNEFVDEVIK